MGIITIREEISTKINEIIPENIEAYKEDLEEWTGKWRLDMDSLIMEYQTALTMEFVDIIEKLKAQRDNAANALKFIEEAVRRNVSGEHSQIP